MTTKTNQAMNLKWTKNQMSNKMTEDFEGFLAMAKTGGGSPFLNREMAIGFAESALKRGYGIAATEVRRETKGIGKARSAVYEIIGYDGSENWEEHCDPEISLKLLKNKAELAVGEGAFLEYKLWVYSIEEKPQ